MARCFFFLFKLFQIGNSMIATDKAVRNAKNDVIVSGDRGSLSSFSSASYSLPLGGISLFNDSHLRPPVNVCKVL